MIEMSTFTKDDVLYVQDELHLKARGEEKGTGKFQVSYFQKYAVFDVSTIWHTHCFNMEAFLTGISHSQEKLIKISYSLGKLSFIDTPKIYNQGSILEGKVSGRCVLHLFSVMNRVQLKPCGF